MKEIKVFFERDDVRNKFSEMLGKRAPQFITSVLQIAANNRLFDNVEPISLYNSAAVAATLDLPLNNNLGFAWIVPYSGKAQFQLGWKGLVQLAQRTGQYQRINVIEVYENQFKSWDALTEHLDADFTLPGNGNIVGYCAYFRLNNGFEKISYWTRDKVLAHGKRYSKSFSSGPWKTHEVEMSKKTVLKNTLSQWGILSIEMQTAIKVDQTAVTNAETLDVNYIDAESEVVDKESERIAHLINDATTLSDLAKIEQWVTESTKELFCEKVERLKKGGVNG